MHGLDVVTSFLSNKVSPAPKTRHHPMITSTSNPRIKEIRKLHRRRHRHESGRILLEGVRLVEDATQAGVRPEMVLYVPEAVAGQERAARLLQQLQEQGVECLACSPEVFASVSDTVTPQGILAVVPLPHRPLPSQPTLVLILDQVRDPGNAGTLLRTAEAAGVDLVLLAPGTVDPFNEKVIRAGMGAHFRLPLRICESWEQLARQLPPEMVLYRAEAEAQTPYDQVDWRRPAALVIGGEAAGPSDAARQRTHAIAIPMQGQVESLNAAVAGAVILFEAARQRRHGDG